MQHKPQRDKKSVFLIYFPSLFPWQWHKFSQIKSHKTFFGVNCDKKVFIGFNLTKNDEKNEEKIEKKYTLFLNSHLSLWPML